MVFPRGERITWEEHEGHALVAVDGYDAIQCETCRFIHVVPIPSVEELEDYYQSVFYQESKPDYFQSAERDRDWMNIGYDTKLDMLDQAIDQSVRDSGVPRRILDIGSGPGHFLLRAKERGWTPVGLEAAPAAVEFSRGLDIEVHEGYFDGNRVNDIGKFDAIHMQHVLEHVSDPAKLLRGLPQILATGGVICIEVPNDFSVVQETLYTSMNFPAWWVSPPEHLNYFSRESLSELLLKCRLQPVDWSTQFPIDLALVAGFDYVSDAEMGQAVHSARMKLDAQLAGRDPALLRKFYSALIGIGLGRELVVVARLL